jgi:tRNA(His) 5'-end guanylyltransferase
MQDMSLGDRMKQLYELPEVDRSLMPLLPACIRLDGRCFHSYCKDLQRPFDSRLIGLMGELTEILVDETNAWIGYTQSDEISLILYSDTIRSQLYFDGKIQKITSILAAIASTRFNALLAKYGLPKKDPMPVFDCRCWNVPTLEEAVNVLIWREQDATRNSVSMAARSEYSHNEVFGKSSQEMMDMLMAKGINWNDYPAEFKRGQYYRRETISRVLTAEELASLPEKHEARRNPGLVIERSVIQRMDMPVFSRVTNRVGVIFYGEKPTVAEESQ